MTEEKLVFNYNLEGNVTRKLPEKIYFWDETLRDGEQTPGVFYTVDEKIELAKLIDEIGVSIINCGIPVVSESDFKAIKAIANERLNAVILAAARTKLSDIDACLKCDVDEISVFVSASEVHMKYKLKMNKEEVLKISVESVEYCKAHGVDVCFVTEDTARSDMDWIAQLYNACIDAGAKRAVVCDTVGVMTPATMRWWITELKKRFKPIQFSIHCHNDFGLAVANELAAIEEGVEVPHTCFNGLGERAGNASFEQLVMALETLYNYRTGIKIDRIYELSRKIEEYSGIPIGISQPVVGYNAFSHESGIHADGMIKHTLTYEPMQPELIGRKRNYVLGKHTGAANVIEKLKEKNIKTNKENVMALVGEIKKYMESRNKNEQKDFIYQYRLYDERRKGISDEEFWKIVHKIMHL